jgi:flagellar protein FliS
MFGSFNKPIAAYRDVGVNSAIAAADPHQLIALLFDGAQAAIAIAKGAMEQKQIGEKGKAISKAIDIIDNGLKASLDMDKGGSIAESLDALYDYMCERLLFANLKNDSAALDEVSRLLGEIQGAWAEIRPQVMQPTSGTS